MLNQLSKLRLLSSALVLMCASTVANGQDEATQKEDRAKDAKTMATKAVEALKLKARADGLIPVNPKESVLIDRQRKRVLLKTKVCNRDVLLEMFLCLTGRKEHESVLVLEADAIQIHAALLAVGAKAGAPVKFRPKYVPASGQKIDVFMSWVDKDGKKRRQKAQEWVRHAIQRYHIQKVEGLPAAVDAKIQAREAEDLRYDSRRKELLWFGPMSDQQRDNMYAFSEDKAYRAAIDKLKESGRVRQMKADFVFSGSYFFKDADNQRLYAAEGGHAICVSNWSEALLDLSIRSTDSNSALAFEAWADRIPPVGTEVTVELIPVPGKFLGGKKGEGSTTPPKSGSTEKQETKPAGKNSGE